MVYYSVSEVVIRRKLWKTKKEPLPLQRRQRQHRQRPMLVGLLREINELSFRLINPMKCLPVIPELTVNAWSPQHSVVRCICMKSSNLQESSHTPNVAVHRYNIIMTSNKVNNNKDDYHMYIRKTKQLPLPLHSSLLVLVDWSLARMMDRCNCTSTTRSRYKIVGMSW